MTELKPCPFCGGEADIYPYYCYNGWYIGCSECSCDLGVFDIKEEAIEAWNKRVPQTWTSKAFERIGEVNKTIEVAE